jgi:hypothetical protein
MKVFKFVIEKEGKLYEVQITSKNKNSARKDLLKSEPKAKIVKEIR